jgi:nucleotide-binding universal stress UspA family protein
MRILIAYDGSPAADAAVQEALRRTWPAGSEVRIVTVVEWPVALEPPFPADYPGPAVEGVRAILTQKGKQTLARARDLFSSRSDLDVTTDLAGGSPKLALLDTIDKWKPDLVMAGSTGKSGLKRFLLGSVCHALVTHAPCSVLVVKIPG